MNNMFNNCSSLTSLDLSSFEIRSMNATNITMLSGDTQLETINAPSIDTGISINLPEGKKIIFLEKVT